MMSFQCVLIVTCGIQRRLGMQRVQDPESHQSERTQAYVDHNPNIEWVSRKEGIRDFGGNALEKAR